MDLNVSLNRVLDGLDGGLRAYDYGDTEMSALQPGDSIHFMVYFLVEDYGINPLHQYAPFRTQGLNLVATYRVPPINMRLHRKQTKLDDFVSKLPVG